VWALPLAAEQPPRAELITAHRIGTTPPMANYLATHHPAPNAPLRVFPLRKPGSHPGKGGNNGGNGGGSSYSDKVLQTNDNALGQNYSASAGFDGLTSVGYVPPDTNISVGMYQPSGGTTETQIVETVNVELAVYDTSGSLLMGPAPINSIFTAAGGASSTCASANGGDPIVLFDKIDQRWIISQLAYNMSFTQNHLCMAISNTADATGKYTAFDVPFGKNLPDYPKLGIWTNGNGANGTTWNNTTAEAGVYFSANIFARGSKFIGAQMCSFPLSDVPLASTLQSIPWPCVLNGTVVYTILPADLEGSPALNTPTSTNTTLPPPPNTAEYFMQFTGSGNLALYQFTPNYSNQTGSVSGPANIAVAPFQEACGGGSCIPQFGTSTQLDSLADRLMYRLSYRNYGGTTGQSLAVTHSVLNDSTSGTVGVRWYQLTNSSGTWNVQQGTFGPVGIASSYRWMGSIAQDKAGDLGIGYSVSSPSLFPGLAVTGRAVGDTANELEPETFYNIGKGYQSSVNRWGDYSSMSVDPVDDCTMYYANEYLTSSGSYTNWGTWITSMKFNSCN